MNNRSLKEVDTIILGAGISGLTLGYYLNNSFGSWFAGNYGERYDMEVQREVLMHLTCLNLAEMLPLSLIRNCP